MAIFARMWFQSEALKPTLTECKEGITLNVNDMDRTRDGSLRISVSVAGSSLNEFERSLVEDSSVSSYKPMGTHGDIRWFQITCSDQVIDSEVYQKGIEEMGIFNSVTRRATPSPDSGMLEMTFPDRASLKTFRDFCIDTGYPVEVRTIHDVDHTKEQYNLTASQREAIEVAYNHGYFSVPQETTIEAISEELGISTTATSERLHRAMNALVRSYVAKAIMDEMGRSEDGFDH